MNPVTFDNADPGQGTWRRVEQGGGAEGVSRSEGTQLDQGTLKLNPRIATRPRTVPGTPPAGATGRLGTAPADTFNTSWLSPKKVKPPFDAETDSTMDYYFAPGDGGLAPMAGLNPVVFFHRVVAAGDWPAEFKGTKVADSKGNPLMVYHGSGTSIDRFKYELTGLGNDQLGSGFYFTTDSNEAKGYTTSHSGRTTEDEEKPGGQDNPTLHGVYLNIRNPLDEGKIGNLTPKQALQIIELSPDLENALSNFGDVSYEGENVILQKAAKAYAGTRVNILKQLFMLSNDFFRGQTKAFNKAVQAVLGYDGVYENYGQKTHWVAWFPEQIQVVSRKSTFDEEGELSASLVQAGQRFRVTGPWPDGLKYRVAKGTYSGEEYTEVEVGGGATRAEAAAEARRLREEADPGSGKRFSEQARDKMRNFYLNSHLSGFGKLPIRIFSGFGALKCPKAFFSNEFGGPYEGYDLEPLLGPDGPCARPGFDQPVIARIKADLAKHHDMVDLGADAGSQSMDFHTEDGSKRLYAIGTYMLLWEKVGQKVVAGEAPGGNVLFTESPKDLPGQVNYGDEDTNVTLSPQSGGPTEGAKGFSEHQENTGADPAKQPVPRGDDAKLIYRGPNQTDSPEPPAVEDVGREDYVFPLTGGLNMTLFGREEWRDWRGPHAEFIAPKVWSFGMPAFLGRSDSPTPTRLFFSCESRGERRYKVFFQLMKHKDKKGNGWIFDKDSVQVMAMDADPRNPGEINSVAQRLQAPSTFNVMAGEALSKASDVLQAAANLAVRQ